MVKDLITDNQTLNGCLKYYQKYRKPHIGITSHGQMFLSCGTAQGCLNCARIEMAWDARNGQTVDEFDRGTDAQMGDVRLRIVADSDIDLDNLFGDTYNPDVNTDIPASRLEREREKEIERVNRDGVWGVQAQYFDGHRWETAESCYGFIGDDWKGASWEIEAMEYAMDSADKYVAEHVA